MLVSLTALFILVVLTLPAYARYSENAAGQAGVALTTLPVLLALIVCLIPTTIGGLLSAIGIAGIDRLMRRNVLATSGRAVEAAGDIDVLLLDKTGTITLGNRMATEFLPAPGVSVGELADAAQTRLARGRNAGRPFHRGAGEGESTVCAGARVCRAHMHSSFLSPRRPE